MQTEAPREASLCGHPAPREGPDELRVVPRRLSALWSSGGDPNTGVRCPHPQPGDTRRCLEIRVVVTSRRGVLLGSRGRRPPVPGTRDQDRPHHGHWSGPGLSPCAGALRGPVFSTRVPSTEGADLLVTDVVSQPQPPGRREDVSHQGSLVSVSRLFVGDPNEQCIVLGEVSGLTLGRLC